MLKNGVAKVNGTELYYESLGAGRAIIFLHGMTLDRRMWMPQFSGLAEKYHLVSYDARGYGKSALPGTQRFSHAEDLNALLNELQIKNPVLVGSSMGGQTALEYSIRYPQAADALVLASPMLLAWEFSDIAKSVFKSIEQAVTADGLEAAKKVWLDSITFEQSMKKPAVASLVTQMVEDYSGYHFEKESLNKSLEPPMVEQLESIKVPVMAVAGQQELPDSAQILEIIAAKIWHNKTLLLKDIGHLANLEDPENFNEMLDEFMSLITSWGNV